MKTVKLLGLAFLAMLVINAIAITAPASAVLLSEILPEPTAPAPLTFTDKGGSSELIPLGGKLESPENIKCKKVTSKGEFTTSKLGTGEIKFEECENAPVKAKCEDLTTKKSGTIVITGTFHIQTGILNKKEVPALVILPEATHFLCGALVLFLILQSAEDPSCIAGEILEPNVLLKVVKVDFKEDGVTAGDQDIKTAFNDADKEYKCQLFFNLNEGALTDGAILFNKNEVELEKFKQKEKEITVLVMF